MAITFSIRGSYDDAGHEWINSSFLRSLPNATVEAVDPTTGLPVVVIPAPSQGRLIAVVTAVLSSSVLSQSIDTYLKKERVQIEVSTTQGQETKTVKFDTPGLPVAEIEKLLEDLAGGGASCHVDVRATPIEDKPVTATPPAKTKSPKPVRKKKPKATKLC